MLSYRQNRKRKDCVKILGEDAVMINRIKKLTICLFASSVLLTCTSAFADTIESITWTTGDKEIKLSDTSEGEHSIVGNAGLNSIEVLFADAEAKFASFAVVPVTDGNPEEITPEKTILVSQQPVIEGVSKLNSGTM